MIGFIGSGNMGKAIISGMLKKGTYTKDMIVASTAGADSLKKVKEELGIATEPDNVKVAEMSDIVVLAIKPVYMEEVIMQIRDAVTDDKVIVTLAPGKTLAWLTEKFGKKVKVVRTMPNTPAMVGEGMTALCPGEAVSEEELKKVKDIFDSVGKAEIVKESMMDAVVGVSGSSPAFVFMFIEAMADAAVAEGMPRAQAYAFASQTVLGSAKLALETGKHPGELKDMVCSPGGTTIEGVAVLEDSAFRANVINAVRTAADKSRRM